MQYRGAVKKRYKVTEKGSDFLGRKTYDVKEVSGSPDSPLELLLYVIVAVFVLILFTLPGGLLAFLFYFVGYFLNKRVQYIKRSNDYRTRIAIGLRVSIFSIVVVLVMYWYSNDYTNPHAKTIAGWLEFDGDAYLTFSILASDGIVGYVSILLHVLAAQPPSYGDVVHYKEGKRYRG
ncbi:hypothetical protein [Spirosoma areae]